MTTNVVVGAASGMGAAAAELLAPRGPLVIADIDTGPLEELASRLGPDVRPVRCDVTDDRDVESLVGAVGPLGALIVTAGLSPMMAEGRRIYEVNLRGVERLVLGFESTLTSESAAVVFASMAGHLVPADEAVDAVLDAPLADDFFAHLEAAGIPSEDPGFAYSLSKRGVIRLVQRHAPAWGVRGGRLLSLSPGIVDTGMGQLEWENQPAMAGLLDGSALPRMAQPEEVARVAAFLVSGEASFMTATDVLVDGGCVAGSRIAP